MSSSIESYMEEFKIIEKEIYTKCKELITRNLSRGI